MLWEPWVYTPCEVVGGLYSVFMSSEWLNTYIVSLVNTVTLMRVPGCWRCDGNETSDSLAKKKRPQSRFIRSKAFYGINKSHIRANFQQWETDQKSHIYLTFLN